MLKFIIIAIAAAVFAWYMYGAFAGTLNMKKDWLVYMLRCSDDTLYTGVTNDIDKRLLAHNTSPKGAKYTKARRPVALVYTETGFTHGEALAREAVLRKKPRKTKLGLIKD